jgi:hypothetical protein
MDLVGWQRRRRIAIAIGAVVAAVVVVGAFAIWVLAPQARWMLPLAWIAIGAAHLALALARRPRRLRARLAAVAATIDDDAGATLVMVDARHATWWLGLRGLSAQWLVLVDDAAGYAVRDARRRGPVEVMRCPWSAVETVLVRDDGDGVDLVPVDPGDPTIRVVPAELRDDPPQLMPTPRRSRAFAARMRARIRAVRPDAAPEPPAPGRDVDWLAPPERARPSR